VRADYLTYFWWHDCSAECVEFNASKRISRFDLVNGVGNTATLRGMIVALNASSFPRTQRRNVPQANHGQWPVPAWRAVPHRSEKKKVLLADRLLFQYQEVETDENGVNMTATTPIEGQERLVVLTGSKS